MNPELACHQAITRRQFFSRSATGVGVAALASLLGAKGEAAVSARLSHMAPRAKRVIYMFMSGGPSHLDLYDYKPYLVQHDGEPVPESFMEQQRFAFIGRPQYRRHAEVQQHGQSGAWFSELLPHRIHLRRYRGNPLDATEQFNHDPRSRF